jgi:uncharacterized glyoxalase superfamily protein PhnB
MAISKKPVPEGFHTVTPAIVVRDAAKAIEFYKKALGAQELGGKESMAVADQFWGDRYGTLTDPFG